MPSYVRHWSWHSGICSLRTALSLFPWPSLSCISSPYLSCWIGIRRFHRANLHTARSTYPAIPRANPERRIGFFFRLYRDLLPGFANQNDFELIFLHKHASKEQARMFPIGLFLFPNRQPHASHWFSTAQHSLQPPVSPLMTSYPHH